MGEPSVTHVFAQSLSQSHAASDLHFWKDVYRKAFPEAVAVVDHRQDGWHQRAGVDRSITLTNSKQVLIDEKVRGRNKKTGRVYEDAALEFLSVVERDTPGWVCKPLQCDYIAYAIAPLGKCWLLPVLQLQAAWQKHSEDWLSLAANPLQPSYRIIDAQNVGYRTRSLCLPWKVLMPAIGQELRVAFTPLELDD
jgi:hypothetical protein